MFKIITAMILVYTLLLDPASVQALGLKTDLNRVATAAQQGQSENSRSVLDRRYIDALSTDVLNVLFSYVDEIEPTVTVDDNWVRENSAYQIDNIEARFRFIKKMEFDKFKRTQVTSHKEEETEGDRQKQENAWLLKYVMGQFREDERKYPTIHAVDYVTLLNVINKSKEVFRRFGGYISISPKEQKLFFETIDKHKVLYEELLAYYMAGNGRPLFEGGGRDGTMRLEEDVPFPKLLVFLLDPSQKGQWGRITNLEIHDMDMTREWLRMLLLALPNLTSLTIMRSLRGDFPTFHEAKHLKSLILRHNEFTGGLPDTIGDYTKLRTIMLAHNQFTGRLPQSLLTLKKLEHFDISHNQFHGPLPPLETLPHLKNVDLEENNLIVHRSFAERLYKRNGMKNPLILNIVLWISQGLCLSCFVYMMFVPVFHVSMLATIFFVIFLGLKIQEESLAPTKFSQIIYNVIILGSLVLLLLFVFLYTPLIVSLGTTFIVCLSVGLWLIGFLLYLWTLTCGGEIGSHKYSSKLKLDKALFQQSHQLPLRTKRYKLSHAVMGIWFIVSAIQLFLGGGIMPLILGIMSLFLLLGVLAREIGYHHTMIEVPGIRFLKNVSAEALSDVLLILIAGLIAPCAFLIGTVALYSLFGIILILFIVTVWVFYRMLSFYKKYRHINQKVERILAADMSVLYHNLQYVDAEEESGMVERERERIQGRTGELGVEMVAFLPDEASSTVVRQDVVKLLEKADVMQNNQLNKQKLAHFLDMEVISFLETGKVDTDFETMLTILYRAA